MNDIIFDLIFLTGVLVWLFAGFLSAMYVFHFARTGYHAFLFIRWQLMAVRAKGVAEKITAWTVFHNFCISWSEFCRGHAVSAKCGESYWRSPKDWKIK